MTAKYATGIFHGIAGYDELGRMVPRPQRGRGIT